VTLRPSRRPPRSRAAKAGPDNATTRTSAHARTTRGRIDPPPLSPFGAPGLPPDGEGRSVSLPVTECVRDQRGGHPTRRIHTVAEQRRDGPGPPLRCRPGPLAARLHLAVHGERVRRRLKDLLGAVEERHDRGDGAARRADQRVEVGRRERSVEVAVKRERP